MKRKLNIVLVLAILCSFIPNWGWIITPRDVISYDLSGIPCYIEEGCLRYTNSLFRLQENGTYFNNEVFPNTSATEFYWNKQYICAVCQECKSDSPIVISYYIAQVSKKLPYKVYGPIGYEVYQNQLHNKEIDLSRMNHVNLNSDSFWNYIRLRGLCCWAEILIILYCSIHLLWIKISK